MAIYRTGTAALSAEGKATGTGTAWTTPLSLIRVGATVIFLSGDKPVLGTISEILSDTEMNLTATGGETAPDGDYAILIHDSLTVEGLAQDISEALRYYQSQESEIGDLAEQIVGYVTSSKQNADASAASATESAKQYDLAKQEAGEAKNQADASAASASNASESESNAAASASSASDKAAAADASAKSASTSEANAKTSETNSKTNADKAAASAASASSVLSTSALKANNLSDLANKATAWTNLLTARTAENARSDLGLGKSATMNVGTASNTVAAGNDSRMVNALNKNGDTMSGTLYMNAAGIVKNWNAVSGSSYRINEMARAYAGYNTQDSMGTVDFSESVGNYYAVRLVCVNSVANNNSTALEFRGNGVAYTQGGWQTYSDKRTKDKIEIIEDPISKLMSIHGYTFEKLGIPGTGIIAQELASVLPSAVSNSGDMRDLEGNVILKDVLSVSPGDLVGLLIEVCRNQEERIRSLESKQ